MPVQRLTRRQYKRQKLQKKVNRLSTILSRHAYRHFRKNYNAIHNFKRTLNWADEQVVETNLNSQTSATETVILSGGRVILATNPAVSGQTLYWAFSYKFNLSNLLNLTEFTSLFDSYKINKVVLKIMPYATQMAAGTASVGVEGLSPILHYVIDHDSGALPAASEVGIATLHEYATYRRKRVLGNGITIAFKPSAQGIVFDAEALNSAVVASELKHSTWFDATASGVDHYGLKMIFEAVNPSVNAREIHLRCETTYYMSFKNPR